METDDSIEVQWLVLDKIDITQSSKNCQKLTLINKNTTRRVLVVTDTEKKGNTWKLR